jgi:methionyl-tRNA formyltransferase
MISIVFMGSPDVAVPSLRALVRAVPALGATVTGVFAQPDRPVGRHRTPQPCPVAAAAQDLGIATFKPSKLRSPEGEAALRDLHPELVIVCAYGHILSQLLLDLAPLGCFNLHFSLLPRWRGASPLQAALLAGDTVTGVSLQRMVMELDAGPLAAKSAPVPIGPGDTAFTLGVRLAEVSAQLLSATLPTLLGGNPTLRPQDPAHVALCRTLRKEDGAIRWDVESATAIERRVRAFTPWPGCHGFLGARRLGLVRVALATDAEAAPLAAQPVPAGTILPGGLVVAATGCVRLVEVKPEGKGAMPWADFARGNPGAVGAKLTPDPA